MKIVTVLGARPQFVKAAAVSRAFRKYDQIEEVIVHTGQHYDKNMSDSFFTDLDIPLPKYQLTLGGSTHGAMTGAMLRDIEEVLLKEQPDFVMIYGDTNSTIAGALAAAKLHIKVAHVEAGLRSFNMKMPEEVNRILTDRISNLLFCPTETALKNLQNEGFDHFPAKVLVNGDVMQDAAIFYAQTSAQNSSVITDNELQKNEFVLCTLHRAENTDDEGRLRAIISALEHIHREKQVVLPLHPRTKKMFAQFNLSPQITLIDPVGYFDMIEMLKHCYMVATDSGGLQKEAFFFENPCITMRDETEWVELVEHGFNRVVGADTNAIIDAFNKRNEYNHNFDVNLYGNGTACEAIAKEFLTFE